MPSRDDIARAICNAWGYASGSGSQAGSAGARADGVASDPGLIEQRAYLAADAAMALYEAPGTAAGPHDRRHLFRPHHRFAWFCTECGYGPGDGQRHIPQAAVSICWDVSGVPS